MYNEVDPLLVRRYYALLLAILNPNFTVDRALTYMNAKESICKKRKTRRRFVAIALRDLKRTKINIAKTKEDCK